MDFKNIKPLTREEIKERFAKLNERMKALAEKAKSQSVEPTNTSEDGKEN